MTVQLTFFDAAGRVTGSKDLLDTASRRILIDGGRFQGLNRLRARWVRRAINTKWGDA